MAKKDCIANARKVLNLFTEDELDSYIKEVNSRTKELQAEGVPFAREAAIKEINKSQMEILLDDAASSARNVEKFNEIDAKMSKDITSKKQVTPIAFLEKTKVNTDYNIETAQNAVEQNFHTQSFGEMTKENIAELETGKIDDDVLNAADGKKHDNPVVNFIAKKYLDFIEHRNARLIQSDAMARKDIHKDRNFKSMYDPTKLLKIGREVWVEKMKSYIDIQETFKNTKAVHIDGKIDDEKVTQFIGNTYDNIIQGKGAIFTRASISRDSDVIKRSRHMFYIYKNHKSWAMANKQFGQETLFNAWLKDIKTSSTQVGMAEIMGTNPEQMYLKMKHIQADKQENTLWTSVKHQESDGLFNNLMGASRGVYNPTVATIGSSIRNFTSTARLGTIALLSINDVSNVAAFAQRAGFGYWSTYVDSIVNLFDRIDSPAKRQIARTMSSVIEVYSSSVSRFSDINGVGNIVSKMTNKFFQVIGLEALDRGNKFSSMTPIMKGFGKQSNKSFKHLKEQQQAYLSRFNISEGEWDALRSKTENRFFTTDNADKLTSDEIKDLWNESDKNIPLSIYKSNIYRKVFAMFDTAHEFSVLQPTAYSSMFTTGNFKSGHLFGELWRMFGQFKAYPIQYFRRVWIGGMQDFDSYQAKMMYALNQSLGIMAMGTLAEAVTAIAKGLTPADPRKMSKGEALQFYAKILGGGWGVFNSILGDKDAATSFFLTPSLRFARDPLAAAWAVAHGDLKGAKQAAKDWAKVANPIATFPIAQPYIDGFLGNKPYLEPGQHQLYGGG